MAANAQTGFDFNTDAFSGLDAAAVPQLFEEARYTLPRHVPDVPQYLALYEHARTCVEHLTLTPGCRYYQMVSGNFIFGDFLEALLVEKNIQAKELTISTYSFSEANIESLRGLLDSGHVLRLNLIMSAGQLSHDMWTTISYALKTLDTGDDRFQFAFAGSHCKLALLETSRGNKLVLDGSANLRSSGCIEQFRLEQDNALYDFNYTYQQAIIARYQLINHDKPLKQVQPLRRAPLWKTLVAESATF